MDLSIFNLVLAGVLATMASYTDLKDELIYNKHVFPFLLLGVALAVVQQRYDLLLSGGIVFAFYFFIYAAKNTLAKLTVMLGGIPLPGDEEPIGGGDVKLSVALALFIGHIPVLAGTVLASILLLVIHGVKIWRATGSPVSVLYMATAKLPSAKPVAFGYLLGPMCVLVAVYQYYFY
ncbi:Type IV leader peptidase family protein [Desulfotomaculum arcticum]|uniref:Type IV leader peptidase family protein n=1 Tax=Desulfotruncus arcticus DSM 17038 TaxID=1121424 RepID=A0A1I2Z9B1_9FIRM|nr:prepilin peptidase [Desulfotruncus arcticus]SFH34155.1 Type IV leader peptidase family protein [Desulfotomaculum arcticum] [Desulfotruncus arcticus DSM 17038]